MPRSSGAISNVDPADASLSGMSGPSRDPIQPPPSYKERRQSSLISAPNITAAEPASECSQPLPAAAPEPPFLEITPAAAAALAALRASAPPDFPPVLMDALERMTRRFYEERQCLAEEELCALRASLVPAPALGLWLNSLPLVSLIDQRADELNQVHFACHHPSILPHLCICLTMYTCFLS
jgi:hypothetical protein